MKGVNLNLSKGREEKQTPQVSSLTLHNSKQHFHINFYIRMVQMFLLCTKYGPKKNYLQNFF